MALRVTRVSRCGLRTNAAFLAAACWSPPTGRGLQERFGEEAGRGVTKRTENSKINAENTTKISMAGAKRVPMAPAATSKPGLRPRTALGDIGNKVSEQLQAKMPMKKEGKPSATGKVIAKKLPKPLEK
ncbi:G2/mitotic-specific cyclin-B1, partial [Saguinus oedipus]